MSESPSSPPLTAEEVLSRLKGLNFLKTLDISEFIKPRLCCDPIMIKLAEAENLEYSVCFGANFMGTSEEDFDDNETDELHVSLLQIKSSKELPVALPEIIFEFGELFARDLQDKSSTPQSTNYFVVIDASSPGKKVWILYDYAPINALGSREPIALMNRPRGVFEGVDRQFDAAQLLNSINSWNEGLTVKELEEHIRKTCMIAQATATTALAEKVRLILVRGLSATNVLYHQISDPDILQYEQEQKRKKEQEQLDRDAFHISRARSSRGEGNE